MQSLFKLMMSLVVPVVLVIGAFVVSGNISLVPPALRPMLPWLPYIFSITGAALAWRFKRSRSVFLLALLGAGCWITTSFLPEAPVTAVNVQLGYALTCFLLPFNIGLLELLEDRGVLTGWGILHFSFIFAQALAVLVTMMAHSLFGPELAQSIQGMAQQIVYFRLLPEWADSWTFIPQMGCWRFRCGIGICWRWCRCWRFYWRG